MTALRGVAVSYGAGTPVHPKTYNLHSTSYTVKIVRGFDPEKETLPAKPYTLPAKPYEPYRLNPKGYEPYQLTPT